MTDEDRISSLPDCLLLEIISRIKTKGKWKEERLMSTKEVIKTTTTISKRWQHLWTRLPTLVFIKEDVTGDGALTSNNFTNNSLFIGKTITQCPTDVNLKKLKLQMLDVPGSMSQVNSWLRYAITRNVQEINVWMPNMLGYQHCDDELFFNNSCLVSMKISRCDFYPPNGTIRWDKLKFLRITHGKLDEDLTGNILSGSPCLETLELNDCYLVGRIRKSLFVNFGVLERLSCDLENYKRFSYDDEVLDVSRSAVSMNLSRCVCNPPTGAILCDKLRSVRISGGKLDEDSIGKILSISPVLETLELDWCCRFRRIDVASKSVKNLVLFGYGGSAHIEINAPYILSLTIRGTMSIKELLLENVSSLVKADLDFHGCCAFLRDKNDLEEELLGGLLSSLGHVNEIALWDHICLQALSRLEAKGFQFRKGSDLISGATGSYRIFSLIHE